MRDFGEEFVKVPEEPVRVGELCGVQEPIGEDVTTKFLSHAHNLRPGSALVTARAAGRELTGHGASRGTRSTAG